MKRALEINLSSDPFRRNRPLLAASIAGAVVLAATLLLLVGAIRTGEAEGQETALAIQQVRAKVQAATVEEARLQSELLRPGNEVVLDQSIFLNALLVRKGISWTLLFADLEEVLPYNVKLIQVRPRVSMESEVQLDMVVASGESEPVIEMLRNMERSELFSATAVAAALPPTENEPLYRYRVSVKYERAL